METNGYKERPGVRVSDYVALSAKLDVAVSPIKVNAT
jgi:hypothetical protein